jgi:membrane-bound metal-dependent hydrolase YbcI (DUF457 family)
MFAGHIATGLAIRARVPKAPAIAIFLGVVLLDLLFSVLVWAGIERVTPTPGVAPGARNDFIDWSHSLGMALVWSALFALPFAKRGRAVVAAVALAVFSHFLLDLPMHPQDLALYPYAATHLGFGLWQRLPVGWWFIEGALAVLGCGYYWVRARDSKTFGGRAGWAAALVLALHLSNSPWLLGRGF